MTANDRQDPEADQNLRPCPGACVLAVETFTARYDPVEDRLCLNAADALGAKQAIFLTRRLCDQIIPLLARHLESKTPKGAPPGVVQSMTQQRVRQARQAESPASPVQADAGTPRWLCTTIRMRKLPAGLAVTLTGDDAFTAQISFADMHLRTVLDVLRRCYDIAGWGRRAFPDWLDAETSDPAQVAPIRLN